VPSTDLEQAMLEYINDARLDPVGNAARYILAYSPLTATQANIQNALDFFGVPGLALQQQLAALTPVQPVAFNDQLAAAARTHDQAMIAADTQSHQLPGEADLGARITAQGYSFLEAGENIYAYAEDVLYGHAGFMVDWGPGGMQNPPGHRLNIMDADHREVGVGIVQESNPSTEVGPLVVTEDFATRSTSGVIILGVAYGDNDHDNFYTVGEGRAGLTVSVAGASTTSTASGGYALQTGATGSQVITLTGGGLAAAVTMTTTLSNGQNLKLDVIDGTTLHTSVSGTISGPVSIVRGLGVAGLTLTTGAGAQVLIGTRGADTLNGASGADMLTGRAGQDKFVFDAAALADALSVTPVADHISDYDQGTSGTYTSAEGDQVNLSSLLSSAFNHGAGQPVASLVRAVQSGSAADLQIDIDGAGSGAVFVTIAWLDGLHLGDSVNVILDPTLVAGSTITVGAAPVASHRNDFNGDARADILWQNDNGTPAIWLMNGTIPTSQIALPNPTASWHERGTGDFNGDGKADILWQSDNGTPAIWLMNGTTPTSQIALPNPTASWHERGAGDFNGDGMADILWQNDNGTPAIWLMNGTVSTSQVALPNPSAAWQIAAAADFNGDGKADILWQSANGTPAIWLMNGTVSTSQVALPNPSASWRIATAADFNGDGKADILWQNANGTPAIWLMNGTVSTSQVALANPSSAWHVRGAGDVNADGKADILWQSDNGTPAIWLMDGTVSTSQVALANPGPSWHAQMA
jgi:hypothetical protein